MMCFNKKIVGAMSFFGLGPWHNDIILDEIGEFFNLPNKNIYDTI